MSDREFIRQRDAIEGWKTGHRYQESTESERDDVAAGWRRGGRMTHDRDPATPQAGLDCDGEFCTIHNPSEHHMSTWPVQRGGERRCPHGIGHPDPDYLAWLDRIKPNNAGDVHGCDGCCAAPASPENEGSGDA